MKKSVKYFSLCVMVGAIVLSLWRCTTINTPPSYRHIKRCFERDKHEINLVKEYLINSGYTDVFINEDFKTAFADFEQININDQAVVEALKYLQRKGYKDINKFRNTIEFRLWDGLRDIGCGISYISHGSEMEIQYVTETEPLPEDEWYYYVTDYEEYRIRRAGN